MVKKSKLAIKDDRFAKIHSDPRFRTLAKKERKIQLDPRFKAMFTAPEFQSAPANVDERGQKVAKVSNPLTRVFDTSDIQCIDEEGNFKWDVQSSSSSGEEDINMGIELYQQEEEVKTGNETLRIAIMNCDWNLVKAVDIFAILKSFSPGVVRVSIYPSEFGKSRLDKEERSGPALSDELDEEALRKYELETMKYYYAVAEFDDLETARKVYDECDGLEIERTSNVLDLRFVPEDVVFPYEPTDVCSSIPKGYKMLDYYSKALQQSRVTLTWDENPRERVNAFRKAFQSDDIDDEELNKYIATPSSAEELEVEETGFKKTSQFNRMNGNLDLEIKFHSGFEELGKEVLNNDEKTVWEKRLEKKSKKKAKKTDKKTDKKSVENLMMLVDKTENLEFKFNPDDERFTALYKDSRFGIDPTSNSFKVDPDGNRRLLSIQIEKRKSK